VSADAEVGAALRALLRERRSVRDFSPQPVASALLQDVLDDAHWAPSWSNTQPYRVAVAQGPLRDRLASQLLALHDAGIRLGRLPLPLRALAALLRRRGIPDGDFPVRVRYPEDLQARRRATGFGLYARLGIAREDQRARTAQMRRNFEFFGAPVALFVFVHAGLGVWSVLDAGCFVQSLLLAAHARGLGTCAQGALAAWASPVRAAFAVPASHRLLCGIALGYASDHTVNQFNPGRVGVDELLIPPR
jgi:nitroreductase